MDTNDITLVRGVFSALAILIGPVAALVVAAFVAGLLVGQRRPPPP
jgi:hypothetical protein